MAGRLATILVAAIVGTTLIAGLIVGAQRDDNSGPVDLIVHNAKVYVADDLGSMAEAVAIRGNKILKVGSEREIMRYRRPQTTILDARGAAVLPGFDDAHASVVAGGMATEALQLRGATTGDDIRDRLEAFADAHPDASWITGYGWSADVVVEPTRAFLDSIVSDRPVRLLSADGRAVWVNTRALAKAGITRRTAAPKNGVIVRDRRGDATGVLRDEAMALVDRVAPKATREERARGLELAVREAQRRGVTTVQDLGATAGDLDLYDAARDAGTLGVRVYAALPATTPLGDLEALARRFPNDPLLKTGLVTQSFDGGPVSSSLLMDLVSRGWQLALEASSEEAVAEAIEAIAAVTKSSKDEKPARHRIEGLMLVNPDDMPRFGTLGIVASLQPLHSAAPLTSWARALGPDRAALGWPARSLSAAGAHLAFGSDWPRLPLDPLASLRAAVERDELQAAEQLTLKSAVNAWTSGAAWASFDDHRKGTLKAGMLADLVVLSTDIFGGPEKLGSAEVVVTIFDGKIVYRRPS
jgi:predicted amidohydrolase YtcJ